MSGVAVTDQVVSEFQTIKLGKKYSYIQMKISDNKEVIEMDKAVETSSYEDFVKQFPANDCRYAIFDFDYELGQSGQRSELVFFVWCVTSNSASGLHCSADSQPFRSRSNSLPGANQPI